MKKAGWITLFYGLFILIGGLLGHVKAASIASLIMGIVFGVLLMICAFGMQRDKLLPAYFGILFTLILVAFFTYRFLMTFQFMPAGILGLVSAAVLVTIVLLIKKHLKNQRQK